MSSWAIVAVPRDDDPVWKLSSEKIPHMTLLFLGEQNEPAKAVRISEFLQHAVETSLSDFGVTVDRRGVLGKDQADVLFFEDMLLDRIKEFRSHLLKNDDISEAYHSVEQYPQWTPHLTLGYPKSPAKKNSNLEFEPSYITFDRIAFWIEDFDGPEFRLKSPELAHYGVKGMKWGVRRSQDALDRSAGRLTRNPKRMVELEAKYLQKGNSSEEAKRLANKRAKVEKAVLVAGAVTLAGVAAYSGHRAIGKRFSEVVLEKGAELKYINALGPEADYNRRLYTTFNEADTKKYRGLLAKQLTKNQSGTTVYETVLTAKETIKAPSHNQAKKVYKELLDQGIISKNPLNPTNSYAVFNRLLVDEGTVSGQEFYKELKRRGFNAVLDSNDQFLSGYDTKKPLILFNAASSTTKKGESVVNSKTMDSLARKQTAAALGRNFTPTIAMGAAAVGATKYVDKKSKHSVVNDYIRDHPNTKRSPAEIYASLRPNSNGTYRVGEKVQLTKKAKKAANK